MQLSGTFFIKSSRPFQDGISLPHKTQINCTRGKKKSFGVTDFMTFIYVFYLFHDFIMFGGLLRDRFKWKCDIQQLHNVQRLITSVCRGTATLIFIVLVIQGKFGHSAGIIPLYLTDFPLSSKSKTVAWLTQPLTSFPFTLSAEPQLPRTFLLIWEVLLQAL